MLVNAHDIISPMPKIDQELAAVILFTVDFLIDSGA